MGASGYADHIVVCGWNSTARELVDELQGDEFTAEGRRAPRQRAQPGRRRRLLRARRRDERRRTSSGPASRTPPRRSSAPSDGDERGRHALDPHRARHRDDGAAGAHRRRGQQPQARRALAAGPRRRDPRDLAACVAAAGPHRALPGPRRASSPTSSPAATAPSSTGSSCPTTTPTSSLDELSARLRRDHSATLLAVTRDGPTLTNPPPTSGCSPGDTAVVVADEPGRPAPPQPDDALGIEA